ncbi:MAG TPA: DsbA family protein [Acidimicrobiia bacterium]|nr:DsbA family protein [Acidimicrobiia bacterium]
MSSTTSEINDETPATTLAELPGGPYDVEFFFDPTCPFAWQTSQWMRRVVALRGVRVGWRFISLRVVNEARDVTPQMVVAQTRGLRYHRVCAAARHRFGNDAVGALYEAWGERYWYIDAEGTLPQRIATAARAVDVHEILESLELPDDLADGADDLRWDAQIRAETQAALRRTGPDVGTPIITYDPPDGNSLFGPVISEVPDDEHALAFYDALRTFVDFEGFSELKRSDRQPLDLPLLKAS